LIAGDASFADLHDAIQDACGWERCHMWSFRQGRRNELAGDAEDAPNPARVMLAEHVRRVGRFEYEYDFGDGWRHEVVVKPSKEVVRVRRLVDGARAFPPEDCGGLSGYERCVELLETGVDPWGEDPEDLKEWLGDWKPDHFDLAKQRKRFDE
jgi:hypothetical protein